jgi:outer membrane usher protein
MSWRGPNRLFWTLLLVATSLSARADFHQDMLIVEIEFNGQSFGDAFVLTDSAGEFYVEAFWLERWEVVTPLPEPRQHAGNDYYRIGAFDGATATLLGSEMVLAVTMPPDHLPTRVVDLTHAADLQPTASTGAYMDYDWNYSHRAGAGKQTFFGLLNPVAFGPRGNVSTNLLYRNTSGSTTTRFERETDGLTVLDLTYTRDDPNQLRSLRIGDVISGGGTLGRSLRMGGVQFGTNFATRPTLVTYPLPSFYGETAVPTALDIYVNGQLRRSEDIAPGNYILEDIPVVNGAGQMQIVTEDALGRQQTFVQDFYVSTELLREGLNDYSFSLGALREDYAIENFRYGDIAGSATWRHGLRDYVTLEGHLEFSDGIAAITGAALYQPTWGGTVSGGLGLSTGDGGAGGQWLLGYQKSGNLFSYNVSIAGTTDEFSLVGISEELPTFEAFASGGFSVWVRGSLGAAITHQEFRDRADRSIISVNYSTNIRRRLSIAAIASWVSAEEDDLTVGVRFSMPFGSDHSLSGGLSFSEDNNLAQVEARRNLPAGPGYGYHVSLNRSDGTFVDAGAVAQNEYGTATANIRNSDAGSEWQLGSSGSVARLGGSTHLTRQVRNAFAVVDVGGYEGVRVYSENQVVGRTDENGQVFIPGLRPYERNQISIEVDDLPMTARIGSLRQDTSPYYKSGVVVEFAVVEARDAFIHVTLPDGTPVRQGAVARVFGQQDWSPIGIDGRVYLHGLDRPSQVTVRWNGSVCDFVVPKPEGDEMIPDLGQFTCDPRAHR